MGMGGAASLGCIGGVSAFLCGHCIAGFMYIVRLHGVRGLWLTVFVQFLGREKRCPMMWIPGAGPRPGL